MTRTYNRLGRPLGTFRLGCFHAGVSHGKAPNTGSRMAISPFDAKNPSMKNIARRAPRAITCPPASRP